MSDSENRKTNFPGSDLMQFLQKTKDGGYTISHPLIEGVERVEYSRIESDEEIYFFSTR